MEAKSNSKIGWIIIVAILLLGVGATVYALNNDDSTTEPTDTTAQSPKTTDSTTTAKGNPPVTGSTVIVFTNDGFEKSSYTSKAGQAVTVRNDSDMDMEFSSDDHPTHRDHPELNIDVLGAGESGTFTPAGKGTYGFHDHINDQFTGTLVVQ